MKSMSHFEQLRRCGVFRITLGTSDGLNGAGADKSTGESLSEDGADKTRWYSINQTLSNT